MCFRTAETIRNYVTTCSEQSYLGGNWYTPAENTRKLAARLLGAEAGEIAFIKNTGEGVSYCARGLEWKAGDEIVTAQNEFPANYFPWKDAEVHHGAVLKIIPERNYRIDADELIAAIGPRTKIVAISSVEYHTGFMNDLAKIGSACRERGVLFFVDAIQSMGVFPLDVKALKIDFLAACGHKWMLAAEGCGIFYASKECLHLLRPEVGWFNMAHGQNYNAREYVLHSDARRLESGGYNIAGMLGLGAALELLLEVGTPLIAQRILGLTEHLCNGLTEQGFQIASSRLPGEASGIVSFSLPGENTLRRNTDLSRTLQEQERIALVVRDGRIRCAPHFYNSIEQMDNLLSALKKHNS